MSGGHAVGQAADAALQSQHQMLGVSFDEKRGSWRSRIHFGTERFIGRFPTAKEAALAYDHVARGLNDWLSQDDVREAAQKLGLRRRPINYLNEQAHSHLAAAKLKEVLAAASHAVASVSPAAAAAAARLLPAAATAAATTPAARAAVTGAAAAAAAAQGATSSTAAGSAFVRVRSSAAPEAAAFQVGSVPSYRAKPPPAVDVTAGQRQPPATPARGIAAAAAAAAGGSDSDGHGGDGARDSGNGDSGSTAGAVAPAAGAAAVAGAPPPDTPARRPPGKPPQLSPPWAQHQRRRQQRRQLAAQQAAAALAGSKRRRAAAAAAAAVTAAAAAEEEEGSSDDDDEWQQQQQQQQHAWPLLQQQWRQLPLPVQQPAAPNGVLRHVTSVLAAHEAIIRCMHALLVLSMQLRRAPNTTGAVTIVQAGIHSQRRRQQQQQQQWLADRAGGGDESACGDVASVLAAPVGLLDVLQQLLVRGTGAGASPAQARAVASAVVAQLIQGLLTLQTLLVTTTNAAACAAAAAAAAAAGLPAQPALDMPALLQQWAACDWVAPDTHPAAVRLLQQLAVRM